MVGSFIFILTDLDTLGYKFWRCQSPDKIFQLGLDLVQELFHFRWLVRVTLVIAFGFLPKNFGSWRGFGDLTPPPLGHGITHMHVHT